MRLTEFIHFLNSDVIDDELYSHLEIRDSDGKIKKEYKDIRKEYRKRKNEKKTKHKSSKKEN